MGKGGKAGAAGALAAALAVVTSCSMGRIPLASASGDAPPPPTVVPVAAVLNQIKCDYLDFAYSDFARARRLPVGRVTGTVTLSVSRSGTGAPIGVAVAPQPLRASGDAGGAALPPDVLTIPFDMDPQLALDPAAAGLDCAPAARLASPLLELTALASAIAPAQAGGPYLQIRSPLRYQGSFYLLRAPDGRIRVVPVRGDPARLGRDAVFLQSFDVTVETGGASWFSDIGPATAEPRPEQLREQRPDLLTQPSPQAVPAPRPGARRIRVPTAPILRRQADVARPRLHAPQVAARVRRCVGAPAELVCY